MAEGLSKAAFATWLAARPQTWRNGTEVVAMDGFAGFKAATTDQLLEATAVMDPFHVLRLAADALDQCRRRVQQLLRGHHGRTGDPLYAARRMLHTGRCSNGPAHRPPARQAGRAGGTSRRAAVGESTPRRAPTPTPRWRRPGTGGTSHSRGSTSGWSRPTADPDRAAGRRALSTLIKSRSKDVPAQLVELVQLGRTLTHRAGDVLASFDRPGTSSGPTEATNGRLEHLRGSALGFWSLANCIARSLPETGGFRPLMHRQLR